MFFIFRGPCGIGIWKTVFGCKDSDGKDSAVMPFCSFNTKEFRPFN